MCSVRSVLILLSMVVSAGVAAQTPATDAASSVLAATREALGGEKKLAGVKTLVATGRTRQVRGDNLVPIEFEIAIDLPDRYVRKDEIPAQESGPTLTGFNGPELIQSPASTAPGMPARAGGPPAPTPEQTEAARRTRLAGVKQDLLRLTLGMSAGAFPTAPLTFTYVAKAEAPQGKADVLAVTGADNFSARLFVNADTHLPIMVTWIAPAPPQRGGPRGEAPSGASGPQAAAGPARGEAPPAPPPESRLFFADYREVGGLQFPFRLRRALGADTVEETTFDTFKINPKIDAKKFEVRR